MSKIQYDTFMEVREYFKRQYEQLDEMIGFLRPASEEDAMTLKRLMSMLRTLNDRMQEAETLSDVADIIDMESLEEDWTIRQNSMLSYSENLERKVDTFINAYTGEEAS